MRHQFFARAANVAVVSGVSYFAVVYMQAMVHSYHSHIEHVKKYPNAKLNSTFWSRFSDTYLSSFPSFSSASKTVKKEMEPIDTSPKTPGK